MEIRWLGEVEPTFNPSFYPSGERLHDQTWTDFGSRNVILSGRVVHLWGLVGSPEEHRALVALAEGVPGVIRVSDETIPAY
jgi:osmotically-inducible protein OsmY